MAVRFDTTQFQFAHGRAPRGFGQWAFDFGTGPEFVPTGACSFADARKWAVRRARVLNVRTVQVCT
jgi:hypothetical protein